MKIDGISAIAVILIASFGIDRIVTGMLFLASFCPPWTRLFPDPELIQEKAGRAAAAKKAKLIYFLMAGVLAFFVAWLGEVRIFRAMGFTQTNAILDALMTGLILIAGADRIAEALKFPGFWSGEKSSAKPLEITGRLILEGERAERDLNTK
ncbi:MAG: hypothetical protein ACREQP_14555 [Candidatus Binatia bacterium]